MGLRKQEPAIRICCATCGSTNVNRDAWASWSEELQMWELDSLYDDAYCNDCDAETKLIEKPLGVAE